MMLYTPRSHHTRITFTAVRSTLLGDQVQVYAPAQKNILALENSEMS